eukprot:TRINITY_DN435_c0_g1_i3.p1 TRINITY_DN435_c0_g1~~TRINITY_DN435_c0_g1_i3.p1  ORF type:complete len:465 (-),score=77.40 TRINITY_DN435_c0_g1_i3:1256-2650(-)
MSFSTLDHYKLIKKLGTGIYSKVMLAEDTETGNKYAIKIMERDNPQLDAKFFNLVRTEVQTMIQLDHPNIVKLVAMSDNSILQKANGTQVPVFYIVLELVTGGELFDFVATGGRIAEPIVRFYFQQLLEVFNYIHTRGICHRDLKAENLLIDQNFNLKLADFGFSAPLGGKDGSGYLHTYLGTPTYMAPEIHMHQPYIGAAVDIFALGVLLFIMVAAHPPFKRADPNDPFYKLLATNRAPYFWRFHSKNKPGGDNFFSQPFKELVTQMLSLDPAGRPTLADIAQSSFLQSAMASPQQVVMDFTKRQNKMQAVQAAEEAKAQGGNVFTGHGAYRSDEEVGAFDDKERKLYVDDFHKPTLAFSNKKPHIALNYLAKVLDTKEWKFNVHDSKYKICFQAEHEDGPVEGKIRFLQLKDEMLGIDISRVKGNLFGFPEVYQKIVNDCPEVFNMTASENCNQLSNDSHNL